MEQQELPFTDEEQAFPFNIPEWVSTGQNFVSGEYDMAVHRLHGLSPSMVLLLGLHLADEVPPEVLEDIKAQVTQAAAREVLIRT